MIQFDHDTIADRLLYRDGLILIIDKPAGLPVHAGPGGGPNLEQYLDGLRFGLPTAPGLAHRLDRDTSGCLVLGRHRKALAKLGKMFAAGLVTKTYWAVVVGAPPDPAGRIELPLAKVNQHRGWKMQVDPAGQTAVTDYQTLGGADGLTWLALQPRTGRTHQIRVHCAALGCPLLGDPVYGTALPGRSTHLHARAISLPLYASKPPVAAKAPPPDALLPALVGCGYRAEEPDGC